MNIDEEDAKDLTVVFLPFPPIRSFYNGYNGDLLKENIMEDNAVEAVSIWKKTASELTVSDQLKVVGATSLVGIVAPIAMGVVTYGAIVAFDKIKNCRKNKKAKVEVIKTEG